MAKKGSDADGDVSSEGDVYLNLGDQVASLDGEIL